MSDTFRVNAVSDPETELKTLAGDARREGFSFMDRLIADWASGANRFDQPGECLFQLMSDNTIIAVGGLNIDPYANSPEIGRIRHVYVSTSNRRHGAGRLLVRQVLQHAKTNTAFKRLRLRATDDRAFKFYENLGFVPTDEPKATHLIECVDL